MIDNRPFVDILERSIGGFALLLVFYFLVNPLVKLITQAFEDLTPRLDKIENLLIEIKSILIPQKGRRNEKDD